MPDLDLGRIVGPAGQDGKTAYQYAVDGGYTGTESEFEALVAGIQLSADAAADSAAAAATIATNAAGSATTASNAATSAQTSKTAAETAKTAAQTAKTGAETAKAGAETAKAAIENLSVAAETLPSGSPASVTKGAEGDHVKLTFGLPKGDTGATGATGSPGVNVTSVTRTSGTGAAGSYDTYKINLSDGTTGGTFQVYNGADGTGAGDMRKAIYDPQNKNTDLFAYVDSAITGAMEASY